MYRNIKVLVVEDEPLIAETIKTYLVDLSVRDIEIEYRKNQAIDLIQKNNFDLVLLDIRMQGYFDGIEIGQFLIEKQISFIYITAHSDKELMAKMIETRAAGFIAKPIRKEDFYINVSLILKNILEKKSSVINLRSGYDIIPIDKKSLVYLKADGNYLELFLSTNEKIVIRNTIDRFLDEIKDSDFVQTHRSYVINMQYLKVLKSDSLQLNTEHTIPVSRTYLANLRTIFVEK